MPDRFEIRRVLSSNLSEAASFLYKQIGSVNGTSIQNPGCEDCLGVERRLRWLLAGNPLSTGSHGYCIRDSSGNLRGLALCFPNTFLAGDEKFLGLGSGGFYVEPEARTAGFYLLKKYLGSPGYAFYFSTTCNAESGALFSQLGGCPVLNAEPECILPLRLDPLFSALMAGSALSRPLSPVAPAFGRCANPILRFLIKQSTELSVAPCQDWEKLSDLFRRYRSRDWITTDRSAQYLQWRYGQNTDGAPAGVYLFRDKRGNEGWFSLGAMIAGKQGQIRASVLLDTVWPRERISFKDIFAGILQRVANHADALFLRPRPGLDYGDCSRWIVARRKKPPSFFAIPRKGGPRLALESLDLVCADGDGALPITPMAGLGSEAMLGARF